MSLCLASLSSHLQPNRISTLDVYPKKSLMSCMTSAGFWLWTQWPAPCT